MPPLTDQLDLERLGLKPGGGSRFDIRVRVGAFIFGAQRYELADDPVEVLVDVTRTTSGYVIRARCEAELEGPCMRCADDFALPLKIDQSEIHEPRIGSDLASDYVEGTNFDIAAFVRDAIGLALPPSISGRIDQQSGGCVDCGRGPDQLQELGLTVVEAVEHEPDPRWAKLRELEL
ncbi:MAG TPA: DUF177 domain-containing protein [Solirubrobacterales bacterium]|jgi:uncharacterized protein|nr:DUF177 domain-containing protein [Solirubrobacterales bacterium]